MNQAIAREDLESLLRWYVDQGIDESIGEEAVRRHLGDAVHEDRAAALEIPDDVRVVDDLLAHIDRRPVQLESPLHGLDCPLDAGAIAPR